MLEVVRVDLAVGEGEVGQYVVVEDGDLELIAQSFELAADGLEYLGVRGAGGAYHELLELRGRGVGGLDCIGRGGIGRGGVGGVGSGGAAGGEAEHERGAQQDGKQLFHFHFLLHFMIYFSLLSLSLTEVLPRVSMSWTTTTMTAHMVSITA